MKVLHLATHLNPGGITNYIYSLIEPLKALECDIYIAAGGGELIPAFRSKGGTVFDLPMKTKSELNPKIYYCLPKILRIIRENQIDLVHAHTRVTQVMACWIQKMTGLPVVTTCHGFYKRRLGRRLFPAWGDMAVAISGPVGNHLRNDFRVPEDKVRLINNGVNLSEIDSIYSQVEAGDMKAAYGLGRDATVVGSVARLVSDKGHEYLIRSIAELRPKFPKIRLLIVGDGPHRHFLENLTGELGLRSHVTFTGTLSSREVIRALGAVDIFAMPATWREGFGLSIVEAMACYKPVIVTNIWSLNSLVQNDVTGILIEPNQVRPLTESIQRLILHEDVRRRIGRAAREMTERFFSISRMAQEMHGLYAELLALKTKKGGA